MIDILKAKEIMDKINPDFNVIEEYEDVFLFYLKKNDDVTDIGGINEPKAVSKYDGKILVMPILVIKDLINDNKLITTYYLD